MVVSGFMRAPYGENSVTIEQRDLSCQVAFKAEFNVERRWANEVDLGGTLELCGQ
jgi:hypothetical protein